MYHKIFWISYNLTWKWNLDINFFQASTYCDISNFSLNKNFIRIISRDLWALSEISIAILYFPTKFCFYFYNCGGIWLANELVFTSDKVWKSLIQFDTSIVSYRVHRYRTNKQTYTFVQTVFCNSGGSEDVKIGW